MVRLLKDETLVATWQSFFEDQYKSQLETIAVEYPKKRSIYVDYWDVDKYNTELAAGLVSNYYKFIFNAEEAIKKIDTSSEYALKLHVRITNLDDIHKIRIRDKSALQLGKLLSFNGIVRKRTSIKADMVMSAWQCQKCGAVIRTEPNGDFVTPPSECLEEKGGCGRVSSFKLLTNLSDFVNSMKIELQENTEDLTGSEQPNKITVYLEDDIVSPDVLNPGDRVTVTGILHTMPKFRGGMQLRSSDFGLVCYSYDIQETTYQSIEITDSDIEEIKKVSKDPEIYLKLAQSIAPSIYGLDLEKEAIVLQLFGSQRTKLPDGTTVRGDIHILLIGDPGTAKSQILKYVAGVAPKSIYASGTSATGAGLTAAAVKDDFSGGQWSLEAGALVLADMGIACIDELDKMNDNDRNKLHTAMEQQEIPIAKAGINTSLPARTSMLAAANPKFGRFDLFAEGGIAGQINLPPTLMSRFDIIFAITDVVKQKTDREKAHHVLKARQCPDTYEEIKPIFSGDFLRKYIAYTKQNVNPVLTDKAVNYLEDEYVELRKQGKAEGNVTITVRQLESLIRLATASARIRLSKTIDIQDAEKAVYIYKEYIKRVGIDHETGKIDIDILETGVSHSQHERMNLVLDTISVLSGDTKSGGASPENVIGECEIKGIDSNKTESALKRLEQDKQISFVKGVYMINV